MYISYPTIEPHYRTPLYDCDLLDVAFIDPSRFKIKALCPPSCFDPGSRQFLGGHFTRMLVHNTWVVLFVCEVQNSFAFIDLSETWFWLYVTFKTHLFASLDMPISKDVWKRLCVYLLLNLPERRLRNLILAKNLLDKRNQRHPLLHVYTLIERIGCSHFKSRGISISHEFVFNCYLWGNEYICIK